MTPTQRPARENELRRVYGAGGRQRTHRNKLEAVADVQVHPGVLYERAADEALRWCRSEHAFRSARRIQPPPRGRSASTSTSTDETQIQCMHFCALHRLAHLWDNPINLRAVHVLHTGVPHHLANNSPVASANLLSEGQ